MTRYPLPSGCRESGLADVAPAPELTCSLTRDSRTPGRFGVTKITVV
jgi:hypothetical protein